jgi:ParB-like nuclease domain
VAPRKARGPAADRAAREPRASVSAGELRSREATSPQRSCLAVCDSAAEQLPFHPLADLFPLLEGADFAELVADIRAHGLHEPIVLLDATILDGRNRYRACIEAGVEPTFRPFQGDDPIAFVISLNLKRRHLDESQRAMVAAKLATMKRGDNQHSPIGETSQAKAAELLNVGKRSVERAKMVRDQGEPKLIEAVERGDVSVSGAVEQIRRGIVTGVAMSPYAERGVDLYQTPAAAVRALLDVEKLPRRLWEPACGPGAIVRVLRAAGHEVLASDLVDYGASLTRRSCTPTPSYGTRSA